MCSSVQGVRADKKWSNLVPDPENTSNWQWGEATSACCVYNPPDMPIQAGAHDTQDIWLVRIGEGGEEDKI